jgi:hypothetical protein
MVNSLEKIVYNLDDITKKFIDNGYKIEFKTQEEFERFRETRSHMLHIWEGEWIWREAITLEDIAKRIASDFEYAYHSIKKLYIRDISGYYVVSEDKYAESHLPLVFTYSKSMLAELDLSGTYKPDDLCGNGGGFTYKYDITAQIFKLLEKYMFPERELVNDITALQREKSHIEQEIRSKEEALQQLRNKLKEREKDG